MPEPNNNNEQFEAQRKEMLETMTSLLGSLSKASTTGTSRRPYYTPFAAQAVKNVIDSVMSTGKPHNLPIRNISYATLRAQWYQGLAYLTEHIGPDYRDKCSLLKITTSRLRGITVEPRALPNLLTAYILAPWRPDFDRYIERSKPGDEPFIRIGVPISDDDINYVNETLLPYAHMFIWDITTRQVKVLRYDRPELKPRDSDSSPQGTIVADEDGESALEPDGEDSGDEVTGVGNDEQ